MIHNKFILTNHPGQNECNLWNEHSHIPKTSFGKSSIFTELIKAWELFRVRLKYDVVVLGGGYRYDLFYLIIQRIFFWRTKPIIKLDCLWYRTTPLKRIFYIIFYRWIDKCINYYVVWASREIEAYSDYFKIDKKKFVFIPYHLTVNVKDIEINDEGFIFSGGNFARDYKTFADAMRDLDIPAVIACSNANALKDIDLPPNVKHVAVSHSEYMQLAASAKLHVVSLDTSLLHSGGQQTFINAMVMGKPVIVNDPDGAGDYIDHKLNGYIVPSASAIDLKNMIKWILDNPKQNQEVVEKAKIKSEQFSYDNHFGSIIELARSILKK